MSASEAPGREREFGPYGGRFVPETLIPALDELTAAWAEALADPAYLAEVEHLGRTYTGRPSRSRPRADRPRSPR